MAVDADNLLIAGNFHMYVGDIDTPAPTSITSALDAGFDDVGYTTRDGTSITPSNPKSPIYGHQSRIPIRYVAGDADFKIAVQMMEWNELALALWLGGATVTPDGGGFVLTPPDPSVVDSRAFVFDAVDGPHLARLYISSGVLTDSGEAQWQQQAPGLLPVTIGTLAVGDTDAYTLWVDFSLT